MKIAIPDNYGEVNPHFGQSRSFAIIEINAENRIVNMESVSAAALQHNHAGLAGLLKERGVEVLIAGGIGPGAIQGLEFQGIQVLSGASGSIKHVAESYARGEFVSTGEVCNHHHAGHHHHQ